MDGGGPSPAAQHHLQRPNLKSLDLKALPREDISSPSETQIRRAKYLFFEKHCSQVAPGIFLAGDAVAKNRETLRENGVTHVVNCVGMLCKEYFKSDGIDYKTYFLQDTPAEDILCVLYDAFDFMDSALTQGGRVLVHCSQGVSRSATIVIAFLMWKTGATYDETFANVKAIRGVANPNIGFCCQLLQWQKRRQPNSLGRVRLYRIASHCQYAPLQLVPKVVTPPKQYPNNTYRDLDTRGAFVITAPHCIYVWVGASCPRPYVAAAEHHARLFRKYEPSGQPQPVVTVEQGEEPPEFVALMDPETLDADQQRVNARRASITGDLLAGTSGITGFSSLGLAFGGTPGSTPGGSMANTPRGAPPPPPMGGAGPSALRGGGGFGDSRFSSSNGAAGSVDAMDTSDNDVLGGERSGSLGDVPPLGTSLGNAGSGSGFNGMSSLGRSSIGSSRLGQAQHVAPGQLGGAAGSRLQIASGRWSEMDLADLETPSSSKPNILNSSAWLLSEVDEYSSDYEAYEMAAKAAAAEAAAGGDAQGPGSGGVAVWGVGAQDSLRNLSLRVASDTTSNAMGSEEQDDILMEGCMLRDPSTIAVDNRMKKYRRSDTGGTQLYTGPPLTEKMKKMMTSLHTSLDDEDMCG